MKVNFKKMVTSIAVTAMCAVPMTSLLNANAADREMINKSNRNNVNAPICRSTMPSPISEFDPESTGITIVNGLSTKVAVTGRNMSTCVDPDGTVYTNCTEIVFDRVNGYDSAAIVTYVFPETEIVGTYGNGNDYFAGYGKDWVCETIVMPETKIVGTYGNGKDWASEHIVMPETKIIGTYGNGKDAVCETIVMPETKIVAKEYLNAYNQIAGHAIKTTTVGVNK